MNRLLLLVLIGGFFLISSCGGDEPKVANLQVSTTISEDGSGKVYVFAEADNAKYFKFYFGDVLDETPLEQEYKNASHTYELSGTYTITVQAHRSEKDFISKTIDVDVSVFIPIPTEGTTSPLTYDGMTLAWSDEFDGSAVDESKWVFEIGNNNGWGNNELQYYRKENASILEGNLMIEAKSESFEGRNFTSTRMITKGKYDFKYGRVDIRAALPEGQGIWPALWMLGSNISTVGWPKCGEIDIMELIGGGSGRDNKIYGTAHWFDEVAGVDHASYGGNYTLTSGIFKDKFHVFSITWDSSYIRWYIDGVKYHEILTTPAGLSEFQENFFLIFNVAVGGNWPGNPDGSTTFPQRMFVDYVRVFQQLP